MFEFIRNCFPYRARSIDDFVNAVKNEGGTSVVIVEAIYEQSGCFGVDDDMFGWVGDHNYGGRYTAQTSGRPIILKENYTRTFGVEITDREMLCREALRALLAIDDRVNRIKYAFPDVTVSFSLKDGLV